MDIDFLTDFSNLARSDFIGIDNETLDFGNLEHFMQTSNVEANSVDNNNSGNSSSSNSNNNNIIVDTSATFVQRSSVGPCNPKIETSTSAPIIDTNHIDMNLPISTVSTRVRLGSIPITASLADAVGVLSVNQVHSHLPESPPDSGSEPPYSPLQDVHGLTLTTRDSYQQGMTALAQQHQHHHQRQRQHHILHDLNIAAALAYTPALQQPSINGQQQLYTQLMNSATSEIQQGFRVKHEAGLIMNSSDLMITQQELHQQQSQLQTSLSDQQIMQQQQQSDMHHVPDQHHLIFQHANNHNNSSNCNSNTHYDIMPAHGMYAAVSSYQNISSLNHMNNEQPASCMLTSALNESTRVQVIGTSQVSLNRASVPTTPVHSASRKRKMSTQLDCLEYPAHTIKHDSSLMLISPLRSSHHSSGSTSPIHYKLQALNSNNNSHTNLNDPSKMTAHSHSSASASPALSAINSNTDNSVNANSTAANSAADGTDAANALTPCIRFNSFQVENWHKLCDQNLQELSVVYYRVDADKGFNFSVQDDAFVCQKKNHFQVTCHARLQGDAKFVKIPSGLEKIKSFHLHFYGIKLEAPNQTIRIEQSQSDRSKKPFYPVPIDLQSHIVSKVTVGRLHFSETTNNNMRKKGRPNPEQRYFQLVVSLHVHTTSGSFPIISQCSERIIVRASNPGQFESEVDFCWQRGLTQDSIFHAGRVGINTDRPDESLVVHGNLKVSGHIVQPSDSRAKQEISELDTSVQLRNLQKIRIVRYRYEPEFAIHSGLKRASSSDTEEICDTGVIAQEVREIIPDAVQEAGSIVLPSGNVIENFLLVNKDRILMENIGAVKELCKVTGSLETRIEHLERANHHIVRSKDLQQRGIIAEKTKKFTNQIDGYENCSSRTLQIIIFLLIIIMSACLAAVSTLYFVEHNKQQHKLKQLESYQSFSNGHMLRPDPSIYINEQEQQYMQHHFQTFLHHKNKTWPYLLHTYSSTTSTRTPNKRSGDFLTYNSSSEVYFVHGNDELSVVMDKPIVNLQTILLAKQNFRITTTAPLMRNKTLSKSKSKWPLPQEVLRTVTTNQNAQKTHIKNLNTATYFGRLDVTIAPTIKTTQSFIENTNSNETSEKVSETISLPQDFENNSIDIDPQHFVRKTLNAAKLINNARNVLVASAESNSDVTSREKIPKSETDIYSKLADSIVVDTIASTSSSNSINVDTTASAEQAVRKINTADAVIYNVYKTVSPPAANVALTTDNVNTESTLTNVSVGLEMTVKKSNESCISKIDNPDAVDLQILSNTNESVYNPIRAVFGFEYTGLRESSVGRRSATENSMDWVIQKTIQSAIFGEPTECKNATPVQSDVCQSVCLGQMKQLQAHEGDTKDSVLSADVGNKKLQQTVGVVIETNAARELNDTDWVALKQLRNETKHADDENVDEHDASSLEENEDALDTLISHVSAEHFDLEPKIASDLNAHISSSNIEHDASVNFQVDQLHWDLWTITSCLVAKEYNLTIDVAEFYPSLGKSLNVSLLVPISKYFKDSNIEVHLRSSKPLQWITCITAQEYYSPPITTVAEHVAESGGDSRSQPAKQLAVNNSLSNILRQQQNTKTILLINIPSNGNFVKDFILRGSSDLNQQKLCDANAHLVNTIFQYNFRIVRDCD